MSEHTRDVRASHVSSPELPVFVTEENRAKLMAIYDESLRHWPVPSETFFVDTRFGRTHVIASGDPASPPLFMTHPMGVGGFVWSSIIAPLSEHRRAYALDTIGDIGKSELADPARYPKKGRDYSAWLDDVFTALDVSAADMVAGSMGGWIAMNHAIYAPDRLRFRPWMRIMGNTKALVGQPFHIPARQLRMIHAPTLVFLGGKDGLIGSASAAARRACRSIAGCEIEVLSEAGRARRSRGSSRSNHPSILRPCQPQRHQVP